MPVGHRARPHEGLAEFMFAESVPAPSSRSSIDSAASRVSRSDSASSRRRSTMRLTSRSRTRGLT